MVQCMNLWPGQSCHPLQTVTSEFLCHVQLQISSLVLFSWSSWAWPPFPPLHLNVQTASSGCSFLLCSTLLIHFPANLSKTQTVNLSWHLYPSVNGLLPQGPASSFVLLEMLDRVCSQNATILSILSPRSHEAYFILFIYLKFGHYHVMLDRVKYI